MATKVSKGDLPQLLSWLQNQLPCSFKLYHALQSHLSGKFPDLDFYVDRWPDPGAAAAVVDPSGEQLLCKQFYQNMVVGVCGTTNEAVTAVLNDDRVVDWSKPTIFTGVADKYYSVIEMLTEEKGGLFDGQRCYLMKATHHDFQSLPVPTELKLVSISEESVSIISSTWKYSNDTTADFVRQQIEHFPSNVLQTDSGEHVGHMIGHSSGEMGFLHVLPPFRRKGYAKVIISQLAQKYFESGEDAYVFIETDNQASLNLHTSVGFRIVPVQMLWLKYIPKDS